MSYKLLIVFKLLLFILTLNASEYINSIETSKKDIKVNIDENDSFYLYLSKNLLNTTVNVSLDCEPKPCKTFSRLPVQKSFEFRPNLTLFHFNVTGIKAGHDVIVARFVGNDTTIDDENAFIRVRVGRSQVWYILSQVVGWIYFFVWSASFWPQNIINFRKKSVIGFNLDFAALNVTGFLFYTIFNCGLYFSKRVQGLYEIQFPRSEIPIEFNDVIYSIHAAMATAITLIQCYIYERGDQRMSLLGKLFTGIVWSAAGIQLVLCLTNIMSWLTFLYYFSYVKLIVTSVKYIPQAWFNYKRKSTKGWSIAMIYMDFTGGVNGLLQMIFIAYDFDDWKTIFGNFAKFGLSIASIFYDILFLLQEYVFYPNSDTSLQPLNAEKDFNRQLSRQSVVSITSGKSDGTHTSGGDYHNKGKRQSVISVLSQKSAKSIRKSFNYDRLENSD